ncbi:MAG: wax ester/triacylglycerol synthase family O-acyltransferase [Pseudomonadota bacterium]
MRALSGLDTAFVYLENARSPMHIGGVYLLDAADAPKDFGYEAFCEHIHRCLPLAPMLRERLLEVPLHLTHPQWIRDPDFELSLHLPRWALPAPGGRKELREMAAQSFSRPLNRSRPLWELAFVEGVNGIKGVSPGSWAMISKVHHAAIDGASGAELMGVLMDLTSKPRPAPIDDDWEPEEIPSAARLAISAAARLGLKTRSLPALAKEVGSGAARLYGLSRVTKLRPPTLPLSAPPSRFNAPVCAQRTFSAVDLGLNRIKAIKNAVPGTTVNDVVLAVCAGGLRSYLQAHDDLPDRPLVAMAPISVRSEQQRGKMGNQVSAMLVGLETHRDDPLERLNQIHQNTTSSKAYSGALPANHLIELIPTSTAALAARLYSRTALGDGRRPFFNLVITNVPGPQQPLYLGGARVLSTYGTAPLIDGLGLILVIFSYAGQLSIGITSCVSLVPDPERLGELFRQSLSELEEVAGTATPEESGSLREQLSSLSQTADRLEAYLKEQG